MRNRDLGLELDNVNMLTLNKGTFKYNEPPESLCLINYRTSKRMTEIENDYHVDVSLQRYVRFDDDDFKELYEIVEMCVINEDPTGEQMTRDFITKMKVRHETR